MQTPPKRFKTQPVRPSGMPTFQSVGLVGPKTKAVPQQVVFLRVKTPAEPQQALFLCVKMAAERTAGACKPKNACAAAVPHSFSRMKTTAERAAGVCSPNNACAVAAPQPFSANRVWVAAAPHSFSAVDGRTIAAPQPFSANRVRGLPLRRRFRQMKCVLLRLRRRFRRANCSAFDIRRETRFRGGFHNGPSGFGLLSKLHNPRLNNRTPPVPLRRPPLLFCHRLHGSRHRQSALEEGAERWWRRQNGLRLPRNCSKSAATGYIGGALP